MSPVTCWRIEVCDRDGDIVACWCSESWETVRIAGLSEGDFVKVTGPVGAKPPTVIVECVAKAAA